MSTVGVASASTICLLLAWLWIPPGAGAGNPGLHGKAVRKSGSGDSHRLTTYSHSTEGVEAGGRRLGVAARLGDGADDLLGSRQAGVLL